MWTFKNLPGAILHLSCQVNSVSVLRCVEKCTRRYVMNGTFAEYKVSNTHDVCLLSEKELIDQ